ncbi:MAG: hypothetical protein OXT09_21135 [Myxococcales bacterium]|nr:hypothetical protein [Myxococcales bacterium]
MRVPSAIEVELSHTSMQHPPPLPSRTAHLALGLGALLACACSDVTHTVGTVEMQSQLREGSADADDAIDEDGSAPASSGSAGSSSNTSTGDGDSPEPDNGQPSAAPPPGQPQFTAPDGCVWNVDVAMNRRLDMYLMVDGNITLPFVGGWDNLVEGLSFYADHPRAAGTGVGVRFFGIECTANTYAMPDAPVDLLPGNSGAIKGAFPLPFNFSPMLPALEGAIVHAKSRANAHPDWKQVVVFMTDGFSTDLSCLTTPDSLVTLAGDGFLDSPSIQTYVIALASPEIPPNPFDPTDRLGPLELVALAGGTGQPRPIDLQAPASDIVNALLDVQRNAEPCEYEIPESVADQTDQLALAMWNSTEPLPRVGRRGECGTQPGYYVSDDGRYLVACQTSCSAIREDGNRPTMLFGCEAPPL